MILLILLIQAAAFAINSLNGQVEMYSYIEVNKQPRRNPTFIQGFEIENRNSYLESIGQYKQSKLNRIDLITGDIIAQVNLDASYFAQGITILDDKVYQLTWKEQTILVYEQSSLSLLDRLNVNMQPMLGICTDGTWLYISDGSYRIQVINPKTSQVHRVIKVRQRGKHISQLSEMTFINGAIWANVWFTHYIVWFSPTTGEVLRWLDLTGLENQTECTNWDKGDVLNGISSLDNKIYITGKNWKNLYTILPTHQSYLNSVPLQ